MNTMKLLSVVVHMWAFASVGYTHAQSLGPSGVFTPFAEFDSTYETAQGQTATSRTITFQCNNGLTGGTLLVGDYNTEIECIPPRYQYYYDKVGTIPRGTQLMIDEVCLTDNSNAFLQDNPNPSLQSLQASGASMQLNTKKTLMRLASSGTAGAPAARQLLQFLDVVAIGLSAAALAEATQAMKVANQAQDTADQALGKVNYVQKEVSGIVDTLSQMSQWQDTQNTIDQNLQSQLNNVQSQFSAQVQVNQNLANGIANTQLAVNALQQSTTNALNSLQNQTEAGLNALQGQLAGTAAGIQSQITQLWWTVGNNSNSVFNQVTQLSDSIDSNTEAIAGVNSIVWDLMHQRQLRNLLNAGFWAHANLLPNGVSPLLKDHGQQPAVSGDFVPSDMYILMEQIDMNYAQPIQGGTQLTNDQVKWYFNTSYALNNAKPFMTMPSLLKLLGPGSCKRAGIDVTAPGSCFVGGVDTCCQAWVEVDTYQCNAASGFVWSQQTNKTAQQTILAQTPAGPCVNVPGAPVVQVFTDLPSFFNYINTGICVPAEGAEYMIKTTQSQQIGYFPAASAAGCTLAYTDQLNYGPTQTAWKWLMALYSIAYTYFQPILVNYNQKLYGRLPGGLTYETVPFVYTPVQYDSNGNVVPNAGAEPNTCYYAYWVAATDAVAPVYSMTPVPGMTVTKSIIVNLTYANGQAPTGAGTAYVPAQIDVYSGNGGSITLDNDASNLLPGNILVVGNINDEVLYDVPSVLLDVSQDPAARIGKATYYLMDQNTTTTWNLSQWVNVYGDQFNALDAAVNLVNYAYGSVTAADGYPVCNIAGGLPTQQELLGIPNPNTCATGFIRQNSSYPAPAQAGATQCNFGTVIYSNPATASFTGFSQTWESGKYVYSYWFDSTTNAPSSAAGFWNAFTVAYSNGKQVQLGLTSGTTSASVFAYPYFKMGTVSATGKQSLADGVQHHIAWIFDNPNLIASLYVDGFFSQSFPFSLTTSGFVTGSSPSYTAPTSTGVSLLSSSTVTTTNAAHVQRLALCQLSLLNPHCTDTGTTESYIIARQSNPVSSTMTCSPSVTLFTTELYESYEPTSSAASTFLTQSQWSTGFWLYDTSVAKGSSLQLFNLNGPYYGLGAVLTNPSGAGTKIGIQIVSSAYGTQVFDSGVTLSGSGRWHHVMLSYGSGKVGVFVDGVATNSITFSFSSTTSITTAWTKPTNGDVAFIQYYTATFDINGVYNEYNCQFGSVTQGSYSPPISYCRTATGTNQGYCRNSLSCNGNCEVLSTITSASQTFITGSNVCDNGYNAPLCLTKCGNYDAASGVCLGNFQQTAATGGIIPNGEW